LGRETQGRLLKNTSTWWGVPPCPPARVAWETTARGGGDGCGSVTSALSLAGGQKATWTWPAVWETGSVAAKLRHSVRQAGVMSSPAQQLGMRAPAAVQPGHVP
jgi:hypothetical protein